MADSLKDPKEPTSSIDSVYEEYQSTGIPDKTSANVFAWSGAIYLTLLSIPLIGFPRFLVILLGPGIVNDNGNGKVEDSVGDGSLRTLHSLESYLAKLTGLSFLTLSAILILQTGSIPLSSSLNDPKNQRENLVTPYRQPTIFFMMMFFNILSFNTWNVGLKLIGGLAGILGGWGFYLFLFPGDHKAKRSVESKYNEIKK